MNKIAKSLHETKGQLSAASKMAKNQLPPDWKQAKEVQIVIPTPQKSSLFKKLFVPVTVAAVTLLFAPKSGKELRASLQKQITKLKENGLEPIRSLKEEFKDTYKEVSREMEQEEEEYLVADVVSDVSTIPDASDDPAAGVGNVHGTPFEPTTDETVPADQLDEALKDVGAKFNEY
ncbi:YtxH domain-containing protein [Jeotgalibaca caeni]|uniref:YtxH domain-containing protein n=1 Tax=Jeotgalibaca caeni TaxID=3028623 RepID=UPI00237DF32E|nr:YtxH domain-containing protein [Jeotgalibaca caeni]MDE1547699.1 YtxH domain-containing protein [Jeotgalibaca caeni]